MRRGEIPNPRTMNVAQYDINGILEKTFNNYKEAVTDEIKIEGIRKSLKENKRYKNKHFRYYIDEPEEEIDVPFVCIVDEIPFYTYETAGNYLGVSKQAVQQSSKRKGKKINGKEVI